MLDSFQVRQPTPTYRQNLVIPRLSSMLNSIILVCRSSGVDSALPSFGQGKRTIILP